jgi:hypothetical protein
MDISISNPTPNTSESTNSDTKISLPKLINENEFKKNMIEKYIKPSTEKEIESLSIWRYKWERISDWFETLGKIVSGVAAIVAYASGFFESQSCNITYLSFVSGTIGILSITIVQIGTYCRKKSKIEESELKRIIKDLSQKNLEFPED